MPWKWAVKIVSPVPPPDGLPQYFWIGDGPLHDPPNYLNWERILTGLTSTWRFDLQLQWQAVPNEPLFCGDFSVPLLMRFQWSRQPEGWLSGEDVLPAIIPRPDTFEPTFTCPITADPAPPVSDWITSVRLGGLAWDGGDELAQYRLTNW